MRALVYDGECPFCSRYVELLKLRQMFPGLELVNARQAAHPAVQLIRAKGLIIDDGMVLIDGETLHHGADAIHAMAASGGVVNHALFGSRALSRLIYPVLRAGRNATVTLLKRRKLGY